MWYFFKKLAFQLFFSNLPDISSNRYGPIMSNICYWDDFLIQ